MFKVLPASASPSIHNNLEIKLKHVSALWHRKPSSNSKPHKSNDMGWEAIQALRARDGAVGLSHFKLLRRLGCGDIGSVYLCELRGTDCYFAMKVGEIFGPFSKEGELNLSFRRACLVVLYRGLQFRTLLAYATWNLNTWFSHFFIWILHRDASNC